MVKSTSRSIFPFEFVITGSLGDFKINTSGTNEGAVVLVVDSVVVEVEVDAVVLVVVVIAVVVVAVVDVLVEAVVIAVVVEDGVVVGHT